MRGAAATRGCAVVLGGATYAALSAARLVAAEAGEPCGPASATSPPLLGQSRRAPFTRRLTAFSAVPVTDLASHINAAPAPFTAPPWGEAPLPNATPFEFWPRLRLLETFAVPVPKVIRRC